jgi:hypothetical protein
MIDRTSAWDFNVTVLSPKTIEVEFDDCVCAAAQCRRDSPSRWEAGLKRAINQHAG